MPTKAQVNEGVERLRTLYSILPGIPEDAVWMGSWRTSGNNDTVSDKMLLREAKAPESCGTTACAMGWAAAHPYFKGLGLVYNHYGIRFGESDGDEWDALSDLFHVTHEVAVYLFGGGDNPYPGYERYSLGRRKTLAPILGTVSDRADFGSTHEVRGERQKAMTRILVHLYLTKKITIARVLDAHLRMGPECEKLGNPKHRLRLLREQRQERQEQKTMWPELDGFL